MISKMMSGDKPSDEDKVSSCASAESFAASKTARNVLGSETSQKFFDPKDA